MHTARVAMRRPQQAIREWAGLTARLEEVGVCIEVATLPRDIVGELDEEAGVLRIRTDAPLDDQLWLLQQAWNWLAIGPHAAPSGQVVPRLRLVIPPQRDSDELPA